MRRAAAGALSVAVAATMLAGASVPAGAAAGSVRYLSASQLPESSRYGDWVAGPIKSGLARPQYFCTKDALPAAKTSYRLFRSDLDAEARQTVTTMGSKAAARNVASTLTQTVASCAKRYQKAFPQDKVSAGHFGTYRVEDGLRIYGVFFSPRGSEHHAQLYGIGRDGRRVTVVTLSQIGSAKEAPVKKFTTTSKTALKQLR